MPASCALGQPSIRLRHVQERLNVSSVREYIILTTTAGMKLMIITKGTRTNLQEESD